MRIIISPAKKMQDDPDSLPPTALPLFLAQARTLLARLRQMTAPELQKLWRCNDQIAALNLERLQRMEPDNIARLTPALLAYDGIQYRYMAPSVFTDGEFDYVQQHLRILSGFYGLLRPFDGVTPYRLEMQARLAAAGSKDLYGFWGSRIAEALFAECSVVVNLASKEYSRCITAHTPAGARVITCVFGEEKAGKVVEKATQCKMARGEMVRWMAENRITDPALLPGFDRLGFRFSPERSHNDTFVFLKGE